MRAVARHWYRNPVRIDGLQAGEPGELARLGDANQSARILHRHLIIVGSVTLLHLAVLWGLHTGLLRRAAEPTIPVELLAETFEPPRPLVVPPLAVVPPPAAAKRTDVKPLAPLFMPRPTQPAAIPEPLAGATVAAAAPSEPLPAQTAAAAAALAAPAVPQAAPPPSSARIELPSSDAQYLQNAKPAYPPISKRLGEQGTVLLQVLIGADGLAKRGEVKQSSGSSHLDQAALNTVLRWRFVPGKRGGVAEDMWFTIPIEFVLN